MKRFLLILIAIILSGNDSTAQISGSFVFEGINRTWKVWLPAGYTGQEPLPLLLALHGLTQNGQSIMEFSGFNQVADTAGFIVAYPDGVNNSWNVGFAGGSTANDVGFLLALTDTLNLLYNVDMQRVYATGFSNGGFMSYRLACESSDRIAAIAPVAGTMTDGSFNACLPQRAVPVLHIHGTSDFVVSYNGGFGNKSVDQVLAYWVDYNACPTLPVTEMLPDSYPDGSTVQKQTWSPCDDNTRVVLLKVINGGHTWPGSVGVTGIGITNRDINASSEIWNFVKQFHLEEASGAEDRVVNPLKLYPNPVSNGKLNLIQEGKGLIGEGLLEIFSITGQRLKYQMISPDEPVISIDIAALRKGIYVVVISGADGKRAAGRFVVQPM
jgi:polyhydroxybutyrate depolymerase